MKRRDLAPDERALWRRATRDVAPLQAGAEDPAGVAPAKGISGPARTPSGQKTPLAAPKQTLRSSKLLDPFRAGDPRLDRHVRRGRMAIDGVIDLHGHTQATARTTLLAYLQGAQARGKRCILAITGKGAPDAGRGVLRARFSDWLVEEDFKTLVVRASPAHARHGGGGAFYVFIKKAGTSKRP